MLSLLAMEPRRSKNFTEKEKLLLIEVAEEFTSIIDNKRTDGTTVEAKKNAWSSLTEKYNAESETGPRTEKQLHALYDNLKKKARRDTSCEKRETYNSGVETVRPKIQKRSSEDLITEKRLEILEIQKQHELMKMEKTMILLDTEIEYKKMLIENAKLDLKLKIQNIL